MQTKDRELIIVGFGPAGLGTSIRAHEAGIRSIQTIDPSPHIGSGGLAGVDIESNSPGDDFTAGYEKSFPRALDLPEAQPLRGVGRPVNLKLATRFLRSVAECVVQEGIVQHAPERAAKITATPNGFHVATDTQHFVSPRIVLAPGGVEKLIPELADLDGRTIFTSRDVLSNGRSFELDRAIEKRPHVAIIGNSHSAYSVADKLLKKFPDIQIDLFKKSPTKPYFDSKEEAAANGYVVSSLDSICPETGKINRFDGIRSSARQLWIDEQAGRLGNRLRSHMNVPIEEIDPDVAIVQATGYTPRRLPLFHEDGSRINYSTRPTQDGYASLHDEANRPLHGAFAIGIGHSGGRDGTNVYRDQAAQLMLAEIR